jgi:hypothetical protein
VRARGSRDHPSLTTLPWRATCPQLNKYNATIIPFDREEGLRYEGLVRKVVMFGQIAELDYSKEWIKKIGGCEFCYKPARGCKYACISDLDKSKRGLGASSSSQDSRRVAEAANVAKSRRLFPPPSPPPAEER